MEFEITPGEVRRKLDGPEPPVLLDVRELAELQIARIQGALHMPMGDVPTRANQELDPDAHIIVLCHHGVRSLNVTQWLRQQGFEKVQSMSGGMDRWSREIDPSVPTY